MTWLWHTAWAACCGIQCKSGFQGLTNVVTQDRRRRSLCLAHILLLAGAEQHKRRRASGNVHLDAAQVDSRAI